MAKSKSIPPLAERMKAASKIGLCPEAISYGTEATKIILDRAGVRAVQLDDLHLGITIATAFHLGKILGESGLLNPT